MEIMLTSPSVNRFKEARTTATISQKSQETVGFANFPLQKQTKSFLLQKDRKLALDKKVCA